jgi:hypothetical protein
MTPQEQIQAAVIEFKSVVQTEVHKAMQNFQRRTGISPRSVKINITEITNHSDRVNQYVVTSVDVGFDL